MRIVAIMGPSKYVPSTVGEIRDFISSMVLYLPDMELPNSGLGLNAAYEQLEHCLGLIKPRLGDSKYEWLVQMARQSHRHFVEGDTKAGRFLLQDMRKMVR